MSKAVTTDLYVFYLSPHHRQARDKLLAHIKTLSDDGDDWDQIAAYCVALITTAGCYIECRINEFWLTALNNEMTSPGLTKDQKIRFNEIARSLDWKMESTLDKYQLALKTVGAQVFDKGGPPYQDAATLMLLRNEIVHHLPCKTEFLDDRRVSKNSKLEGRLQTLIRECPYEGIKSFFPQNCLHHACAEWAGATSQIFVDEFLVRAGANTKVHISTVISRM
jgi:hypothetical protein